MGEILCAGTTHYPPIIYPDETLADVLRFQVNSNLVPDQLKDPRSWPKPMVEEYGPNGENATASAKEHRSRIIGAYRKLRAEIEAFKPDFLVIWGDDQYENFQEDLVPPFCVYIADTFETQPFVIRHAYLPSDAYNVWQEPDDKVFVTRGHPNGAKYLTSRLLEMGYAIPYSYKPLHFQGLGHAFLNTVMYLDYDREGFDYPVVPFHVNCYGSSVIRSRGGTDLEALPGGEPDPPAPTPRLCFDIGAATATVLKESPWRVVLIGSSSWSHATLTLKNHTLWPDVEADSKRFEDLRDGKFHTWKDLTPAQLEDSGQHELLNWVCLAGAMTELGCKTEVLDFTQTYIFNSSKCTVVARPAPVGG